MYLMYHAVVRLSLKSITDLLIFKVGHLRYQSSACGVDKAPWFVLSAQEQLSSA